MNGARDEDSPLAIDDEGLPVVGHAALDQLEPTNNEEEEGEDEEARCELPGNRGGSHLLCAGNGVDGWSFLNFSRS